MDSLGRDKMSAKAREFIDYWIKNSVHATERYGSAGAEPDVTELTRRCIAMAAEQGITETAMRDVVGDIASYIADKLKAADKAGTDRKDRG
jgi:hypothetical protein